MTNITWKEYTENPEKYPEAYLETYRGMERITGIREDWAVCGFGFNEHSYMMHNTKEVKIAS